MSGQVFLVGAGPGDPHLITEKAKHIIQNADVIVYDSLINTELLELNMKGARVIYVGKRRGRKKFEQEEINSILVEEAKKGNFVARLKGGDPFVFGRGGEEAQFLKHNNVEFSIVPGVSSVTAVPAYSGIPITHRDYNSSFTVITGHEDPSRNESRFDWESISKMETLVILMSLGNTDKIMKKLIENGKPSDTPVSITSWGTMPFQKNITGTISNIGKLLKKNPQIRTPAVTVVGKIVELRNELKWFENRPLFGRKVMITRPSHQIPDFRNLLNYQGAEVIEFPTIEISEPDSWSETDKAIDAFKRYDYVIFTSTNGVEHFFRRLKDKNLDSRIFGGKTVVTIGKKTAYALRTHGINADLVPDSYIAEGIIDLLGSRKLNGKKVLIPRSPIARDVLPEELHKMGASVDVVACYKTVVPSHGAKKVRDLEDRLQSGGIDVVAFTSSSAASNFFQSFKNIDNSKRKFKIACIGPITAETVRAHNLTPEIIASEYTIEGLADQISKFFTVTVNSS